MQTMTKMASLAVITAALCIATVPTAAQNVGQTLPADPDVGVTRVGTRGANFLELGIGGRAAGLAGAYSAIAEGMSAVYWNPAGVADLKGVSGTISYQDLYSGSGLKNSYAAIGFPIGQNAFALSLTHFSSGNILRTTEQFPDGYDPAYGSTIEWAGNALGLTFGRRVTDRLAFGVTAKYAQEGVDFATASWVGVDLGTVFRTGLLASTVGISISNLGGRASMKGPAIERRISSQIRDQLFPTERDLPATFRTGKAQMPTMFRFGLRTDLVGGADALVAPNPTHRLDLLTEISDAIDGPIEPVVALEYGWNDHVFARAGKRFLSDDRAGFGFGDGLAAGFGLKVPALGRALRFDYGIGTRDPLGNTQTFSLELGF